MKALRPSHALLALGALAGTLGACNFVVGVGNFAVGDEPASGDGGLDATMSGDSEAASADAGSDAPVACGSQIPTTKEFAQLVDACVLWGGCTGHIPPVSLRQCIQSHWFTSNTTNAVLLCLQNATSCAGVTTCTGEAWATATQCPPSASTVPVGTCDNGTAINCTRGEGTAVNCSKYAGTTQCGVYANATGGGTTAGCIVEGCKPDSGVGVQCDTQTNTLFACVGDAGYGANCDESASECKTYGTVTGCYVKGTEPCPTAGAISCTSPTSAALCADTNTLLAVDCATAGETCVAKGQSALCVSAGCTFDQASACKESCGSDGVTANLCVGGATYPVHCTSYPDFQSGGCVVQSNGFVTCTL